MSLLHGSLICRRLNVAYDLLGPTSGQRFVTPQAEVMVALHARHIILASTAQRLLDVTDAVDRIRRDPSERLIEQARLFRDTARLHIRLARPLLGARSAGRNALALVDERIGWPALGQSMR